MITFGRPARIINRKPFVFKALGLDNFVRSMIQSGMVYFIQGAITKKIKIGFTKAKFVNQRLTDMQVGSPDKLIILGLISEATKTDEKQYHEHFLFCRSHGEWFNPDPELIEFIQTNRDENIPTQRKTHDVLQAKLRKITKDIPPLEKIMPYPSMRKKYGITNEQYLNWIVKQPTIPTIR